LPDLPQNLVASGNISSPVPWLTGVNSQDGLIFVMGMLKNSTVHSPARELNASA